MRLLECLGHVPVIHFGDLDPNGVRIVQHLRGLRSDPRWFVPNFDQMIEYGVVEPIACARDLARLEGIFCGISAGGTFAAALDVASRAQEASVLLAMLPDTGERYLSTALFEGYRPVRTRSERLSAAADYFTLAIR